MENLKIELIKENELRLNENLKKCETEEGLKQLMSFEGKTYKGDIKGKFLKFLKGMYEKRLNEQLEQLKEVAESKEFGGELIITLDWKKSRMWGSNPRAYTNYGFEGESISGCGYCKTSTATAQALNSHLPLLKLLYLAKDKAISDLKQKEKMDYIKGKSKDYVNNKKSLGLSTSDINRKFLGYGAGYSILPSFEGGVGVSSHQRICEGLGLSWKNITSTNNTDVFMISGVTK